MPEKLLARTAAQGRRESVNAQGGSTTKASSAAGISLQFALQFLQIVMSANHTSPSTGGQGSGASGAGHYAMSKASLQQRQQSQNAAKYYAAGIVGMIAIFAIFHWARYTYSLFATRRVKKSSLMKRHISVVR